VAWLPGNNDEDVVLGRTHFAHCSDKAYLVKVPHQHLKIALHTTTPQHVWFVTAIGINPACVKTQTGLIKKILPDSRPVQLCVGDVLCGLWDSASSTSHFPLVVREVRGDSPRPVTPADVTSAASLKVQRAPTEPMGSHASDESLLRSFTLEAEAALARYQEQVEDASALPDAVKAADDVVIDLGRVAIAVAITKLYDPAYDYKTRTRLYQLPQARGQLFWDHPPKKLKKSDAVHGEEVFFVPQASPSGYVTPYRDGMVRCVCEWIILPPAVRVNEPPSRMERCTSYQRLLLSIGWLRIWRRKFVRVASGCVSSALRCSIALA
jgi:hypothetical protein